MRTYSRTPVLGFVLICILNRIVNKSKTSGLSSSEDGSKTKTNHSIRFSILKSRICIKLKTLPPRVFLAVLISKRLLFRGGWCRQPVEYSSEKSWKDHLKFFLTNWRLQSNALRINLRVRICTGCLCSACRLPSTRSLTTCSVKTGRSETPAPVANPRTA